LSVGTAVALVPLMPKALALPSPERLATANRNLQQEIERREHAEKEIKELNDKLEQRVIERTAQLEAANQKLQNEIAERERTEIALRESEAHKRAILESVLDSIISTDHAGRIIDFNAAAEKAFGFRRTEVMGKELLKAVFPPSFREQHQAGVVDYL